jgi:excisionase family DNA binding protein
MTEAQRLAVTDNSTLDGLDKFFSTDQGTVDSIDTMLDKESWTVTEAAKQLGLSEKTVRRYLHAGKLRGYKVKGQNGDEWRVKKATLDNNRSEFQGRVVTTPRTVQGSVDNGLVKELIVKLEALAVRNGYLESQMSVASEQLKLLPDLQAKATQAAIQEQKIKDLEVELAALKASWWARFKSWASGVR